MIMTRNDNSTNLSFYIYIFITIGVILLRLFGIVKWSWWFVLSPILLPVAVATLLVIMWLGARMVKLGGSNEADSDWE